MMRRFAIINMCAPSPAAWKPSAYCDSTSLADGDLVKVTRQAKDRVGQIRVARFSPAHSGTISRRWRPARRADQDL